jgi:hypothetical protein
MVPPENVVLVVGFFMSFFGLLFSVRSFSLLYVTVSHRAPLSCCKSPPPQTIATTTNNRHHQGVLPPVEFETLYNENKTAVALFSGYVSSTRYFVEGFAVHELRCLPMQSGFTVEPYAFNFPLEYSVPTQASLGQNDRAVVQHTCNGWYWEVLPAVAVGVTVRFLAAGAIHAFYRSKQARKPYVSDLLQRPLFKNRVFLTFIIYMITFLCLFGVTSWFMLRTVGQTGIWDPAKDPTPVETLLEVVDYYDYLFP